MIKKFLFTMLGLLLVACSSKETLQPKEKMTSDDEIMQTIEEIPAGADPVGTLTFFPGDERGVVVRGVRWNQGLSSENPGADCELVQEPEDAFGCTPKKGIESVHLTIRERTLNNKHVLFRIIVVGKSLATRDRWINQLGINGFVRQGKKDVEGSHRTYYASGDRASRAEVSWIPKTEEVTVTVGPPAGK